MEVLEPPGRRVLNLEAVRELVGPNGGGLSEMALSNLFLKL